MGRAWGTGNVPHLDLEGGFMGVYMHIRVGASWCIIFKKLLSTKDVNIFLLSFLLEALLFSLLHLEISIWISRLSKQDKPSATWVSIIQSNPLRALREQKWRKKIFPSPFLRWIIRLFCLWTSELLVLEPSDWDWITPLAFLVLYLSESIWWDFWSPQLHKPHLSLFLSYWFCLSGECWLIKISGRLSSPALLFKVVLAIQVLCWIEVVIMAILVLLLDSYARVHH